jgi:hypothetical protein
MCEISLMCIYPFECGEVEESRGCRDGEASCLLVPLHLGSHLRESRFKLMHYVCLCKINKLKKS